jgi:hypothetical protein
MSDIEEPNFSENDSSSEVYNPSNEEEEESLEHSDSSEECSRIIEKKKTEKVHNRVIERKAYINAVDLGTENIIAICSDGELEIDKKILCQQSKLFLEICNKAKDNKINLEEFSTETVLVSISILNNEKLKFYGERTLRFYRESLKFSIKYGIEFCKDAIRDDITRNPHAYTKEFDKEFTLNVYDKILDNRNLILSKKKIHVFSEPSLYVDILDSLLNSEICEKKTKWTLDEDKKFLGQIRKIIGHDVWDSRIDKINWVNLCKNRQWKNRSAKQLRDRFSRYRKQSDLYDENNPHESLASSFSISAKLEYLRNKKILPSYVNKSHLLDYFLKSFKRSPFPSSIFGNIQEKYGSLGVEFCQDLSDKSIKTVPVNPKLKLSLYISDDESVNSSKRKLRDGSESEEAILPDVTKIKRHKQNIFENIIEVQSPTVQIFNFTGSGTVDCICSDGKIKLAGKPFCTYNKTFFNLCTKTNATEINLEEFDVETVIFVHSVLNDPEMSFPANKNTESYRRALLFANKYNFVTVVQFLKEAFLKHFSGYTLELDEEFGLNIYKQILKKWTDRLCAEKIETFTDPNIYVNILAFIGRTSKDRIGRVYKSEWSLEEEEKLIRQIRIMIKGDQWKADSELPWTQFYKPNEWKNRTLIELANRFHNFCRLSELGGSVENPVTKLSLNELLMVVRRRANICAAREMGKQDRKKLIGRFLRHFHQSGFDGNIFRSRLKECYFLKMRFCMNIFKHSKDRLAIFREIADRFVPEGELLDFWNTYNKKFGAREIPGENPILPENIQTLLETWVKEKEFDEEHLKAICNSLIDGLHKIPEISELFRQVLKSTFSNPEYDNKIESFLKYLEDYLRGKEIAVDEDVSITGKKRKQNEEAEKAQENNGKEGKSQPELPESLCAAIRAWSAKRINPKETQLACESVLKGLCGSRDVNIMIHTMFATLLADSAYDHRVGQFIKCTESHLRQSVGRDHFRELNSTMDKERNKMQDPEVNKYTGKERLANNGDIIPESVPQEEDAPLQLTARVAKSKTLRTLNPIKPAKNNLRYIAPNLFRLTKPNVTNKKAKIERQLDELATRIMKAEVETVGAERLLKYCEPENEIKYTYLTNLQKNTESTIELRTQLNTFLLDLFGKEELSDKHKAFFDIK